MINIILTIIWVSIIGILTYKGFNVLIQYVKEYNIKSKELSLEEREVLEKEKFLTELINDPEISPKLKKEIKGKLKQIKTLN